MVEIRWDIRRGADIYRQIWDSRLKRWISTAKIKPGEVVVWRSGFSGWRRPEELDELIPYFRRYEKLQLRKLKRKKLVRKTLSREIGLLNPEGYSGIISSKAGSDSTRGRALSEKTRIKNILIIDDEKDLCQLLGDSLSSSGYNVESANTRREAMSSLKSRFPDLVFLDLKLSDGNGLKLLSCIKKLNPGTRVNIISAYGTEEVRDYARKLGAYSFIDKPFSEEDILRSISEHHKLGVS